MALEKIKEFKLDWLRAGIVLNEYDTGKKSEIILNNSKQNISHTCRIICDQLLYPAVYSTCKHVCLIDIQKRYGEFQTCAGKSVYRGDFRI